MKKIYYVLLSFIILSGVWLFYSYRLLQVPPGLTVDEASIGYNASLISKTLRDETGRLLPVFPLTISGKDWKQPSTVYLAALSFKLLGASLYHLRQVSVLTTLISFILVVVINYLLFNKRGAIISGLIFISVPTLLIHSHLAQENIMPVPFVSAWILGLLIFQKRKNLPSLVISGICLGLGIYSYKGMRAIVPVLALTSFIYLLLLSEWQKNSSTILHKLVPFICFCLGLFPFVLIMPWLNTHYAGALFDNQGFTPLKYYDFLYPYLSSFDISALFIKGDITPWHSTGFHGMFLISTLPFFLLGLISSARQKTYPYFWSFLLLSFFLSPLLFGQVGSVYRFSRLLVFVPFFVIFSTLGVERLLQSNRGKIITLFLTILMFFNFIDFVKYYWFVYPVFRRTSYGQNIEPYYLKLANLSQKYKLVPYIYTDDYLSSGEDAHFFEAAYFNQKIKQWRPGEQLPKNSLLMTKLASQSGMVVLDQTDTFTYLIKQ